MESKNQRKVGKAERGMEKKKDRQKREQSEAGSLPVWS